MGWHRISARFIGWHNNIVRNTDIILEFIKRYLVHTENVGVVENYIGNVPAWILLVCVVIISPVFEELLFRKVLLEELLPYGKITAILISSMLFGMLP